MAGVRAASVIPVYEGPVPSVSRAQMIEVDRAMVEDFHIELIQMMENAGRNLARLARDRFLNGSVEGRRIVVLCGSGGNGGGALACARHMSNRGAEVQVLLSKEAAAFEGIPARQLDIVRRMGIPIGVAGPGLRSEQDRPADLLVDGIIGYSLRGEPRGGAAQLICWSNEQATPVLALDLPSGLDATTGEVFDPTVRADATMTLALPKVGLLAPTAATHRGELYVADIGVPAALYARAPLGIEVADLFAHSEVIRLDVK